MPAVLLLALAVGGTLAPPARRVPWAVPAAAAVAAVALGVVAPAEVGDVARSLAEPLAFLLAAVPLAVLLDRAGLFEALAGALARRGHGPLALWGLAAATVALVNLDAAVVVLTPLYLRLARRTGRDGLALAAMPVVLALLASSLLPVSNLTNLVAAEQLGLAAGGFLAHLGLPTVVAVAVGWWAYRRRLGPPAVTSPASVPGAVGGGRGTALAGAVLGVAVVGFAVGPAVGVAPWAVAVAAVAVLAAHQRALPWAAVPVGPAVLVVALGVVAVGVADALDLAGRAPGSDGAALAATLGLGAAAASAVSNLPAFLVGLEVLAGSGEAQVWALLLAVNAGPGLVVTGSLSSLLWASIVAGAGERPTARWFLRLGLTVTIPAYLAAAAAFLAQQAVLGRLG